MLGAAASARASREGAVREAALCGDGGSRGPGARDARRADGRSRRLGGRKGAAHAEPAHLRGGAHGEPRRRCPDCRPHPGDGAAQDGHARLRRDEDRERGRHGTAGAGCQERPARDRPPQRLHPVRRPGALHRERGRRGAGGARPQSAGRGVARLRHAVLRHLQALQQRLLQDRPAAVQPRRSVADEHGEREDVPRGTREPRRVARIVARDVNLGAVRVAILSARQGWHTDQLCRALAERGYEGRVLPYEALVAHLGRGAAAGVTAGGDDLGACAAVLARIIPAGSLEQIVFRVDALHTLEERGTPVVNSPRTIERTVDKLWTTALLEQAGLRVPETVVCESADAALAAFRALGDVIVKPLFGSMGLGMVRVTDEEMAFRVFRTLETLRGVYYVQRTIDHGGCDVRAFVVGGRVIGAIERSATGWKTNLARGGRARAVTLEPEQTELALAAAHAVGADYAGVDLLPARDGTVYVVEENGLPGWRGLQEATSPHGAAAIVELLVGRLARR